MHDIEKNLYADIAFLLEQARNSVQRATNAAMVYTYFEIGRRIVEGMEKGVPSMANECSRACLSI